jgi:hypothetical protein
LNFTFKILSKPALDWFSKNCTCLCKGPLNTRKGKQFGTSLKQETLNHHHTCGISLEVFSMNGALAQPCIACKSLAKVVWPPAILLTGDTESYTFIRGGHRTWNVPKVSGNLNDACQAIEWQNSMSDSVYDIQVSSSQHMFPIYYPNFPASPPWSSTFTNFQIRMFTMFYELEMKKDSTKYILWLFSLRVYTTCSIRGGMTCTGDFVSLECKKHSLFSLVL